MGMHSRRCDHVRPPSGTMNCKPQHTCHMRPNASGPRPPPPPPSRTSVGVWVAGRGAWGGEGHSRLRPTVQEASTTEVPTESAARSHNHANTKQDNARNSIFSPAAEVSSRARPAAQRPRTAQSHRTDEIEPKPTWVDKKQNSHAMSDGGARDRIRAAPARSHGEGRRWRRSRRTDSPLEGVRKTVDAPPSGEHASKTARASGQTIQRGRARKTQHNKRTQHPHFQACALPSVNALALLCPHAPQPRLLSPHSMDARANMGRPTETQAPGCTTSGGACPRPAPQGEARGTLAR